VEAFPQNRISLIDLPGDVFAVGVDALDVQISCVQEEGTADGLLEVIISFDR
jgi:hypothetical protein